MGNFNRDRGLSAGRNFGRRDFGGRSGDRQMFKAVCANCGKDCEVPFVPTSGKPVYCRECFGKMKGDRQDFPRPERSAFRAPIDQNKIQLDSINAKLDKILKLLESKVIDIPAEVSKAPEVNVKVKEAKSSKAKKVAKK